MSSFTPWLVDRSVDSFIDSTDCLVPSVTRQVDCHNAYLAGAGGLNRLVDISVWCSISITRSNLFADATIIANGSIQWLADSHTTYTTDRLRTKSDLTTQAGQISQKIKLTTTEKNRPHRHQPLVLAEGPPHRLHATRDRRGSLLV